ncbi:MAG: preprotein translocase subunit SecG [Gammaproteobacteria bacterium]|nr:preprotein translocase subunit SecG [Gammaproteobacteria bacterium]
MSTIEIVLLALLVTDALVLTILVLMQQGKGADVGAAFGSGSSSTMFGSVGSGSFLTSATSWLAVAFFVIAFALAYIAKEKAGTVSDLGIPQIEQQVPSSELTDIPGTVDSLNFDGDIPSTPASETDVVEDIPEL